MSTPEHISHPPKKPAVEPKPDTNTGTAGNNPNNLIHKNKPEDKDPTPPEPVEQDAFEAKEEQIMTEVEEPEAEDTLLADEEQNDFFWIIQRVLWGTLKTVVILGGVAGLVWFVWDPKGATDISNLVPTKTEKPEIPNSTEKTKIPALPIARGDLPPTPEPEMTIIRQAYDLEKTRVETRKNVITDSILWLEKAKNLGEISLTLVRIQDPVIRAAQIEDTLVEAEKLITQSKRLQEVLREDLGILSQKKNREDQIIAELEKKILENIKRFEPQSIDSLVQQKVAAEKRKITFENDFMVREVLFRNVRSFEKLLRTKALPLIRPVVENTQLEAR